MQALNAKPDGGEERDEATRDEATISFRTRGFTIVELLVVISIIGLLFAMLLPALQTSRASARRATCQHHLQQIGIGLQAYCGTFEHFPPGVVEWRAAGKNSMRQLAWSAFLLPFVDEQSLFDQLDLRTPFDSPENAVAAAVVIPLYLCPESRRGEELVDGRAPCDYGGLYGERITSANHPPKGIMIHDRGITIPQIEDGLSKTIMVAEDSRFPDGQWINGRNVFDQAFAINEAPLWENDIRSEHPGGALVTMADGSIRFLLESLDLPTLAALCTRAGHEPD